MEIFLAACGSFFLCDDTRMVIDVRMIEMIWCMTFVVMDYLWLKTAWSKFCG